MRSARFAEILRTLAANDVELIVVGMLAGVLQGCPVSTADVDVVHRRTRENVARLLGVLQQLEAVYRHDPRKLRPKESHLIGAGHQLLETTHGDLDCLGSVGDGLGYEELLEDAVPMDLGHGLKIQVLGLAKLIELKKRAGRPKDLAAIPVLEATLEELERR
jgi:hypothetical protein